MRKTVKFLFLTIIFACVFSVSAMAENTIDVGLFYADTGLQSVALKGTEIHLEVAGAPVFKDMVVMVEQSTTVFTSPTPLDSTLSAPAFINSEGVFALYQESPPEDAVMRTIQAPALRIQENGVLSAIVDLPYAIVFEDISDGTLSLDAREYQGKMLLLPAANGAISVVNRLDVESYLCGVLPYEMSTGWPMEALKAQAVAARNYVMNNNEKHKSDGFDLCNTTHCQVYRGISGQATDCTQAVMETAGVYLVYEGKPAQTFYFSSSGGRTENVKDVWGSSFPYLVSVDDPYEKTEEISSANWNYTINRTALTECFKSYNLGTVTDVSILSTTDGGRAKVIEVTGSLKSAEIKATELRSLLGVSRIKGTNFVISKTSDDTYSVLSANGKTKGGVQAYVLSSDDVALRNVFAFVGSAGIATFSPSYTQFEFVGKGYGHGVGMSQWGARGMAEAGFTYDQILTHYFTGTELKTEE